MEFTLLGTSSGLPTMQRNVSGLVLSSTNSKAGYLVDCGEGTQHQMLRSRYASRNLEAIFITHVHGDHVYGIFGLISSMGMSGRGKPLHIFGPEGVREMVETVLKHSDSHVDFPLEFHLTQPGQLWADDRFVVEAIALSHRVTSYAYHFTEQPRTKLKVDELLAAGVPQKQFGVIQKGGDVEHDGKLYKAADYREPLPVLSMIVGGDNDTPELLADNAKRANVMVHEATFTEEVSERVGPAPMHSTARKVGLAAQQAGLQNLVLTHFSGRYAEEDTGAKYTVKDLADEAKVVYHGALFMAADLDQYQLGRDGSLSLQRRAARE